MKGSDKFLVNHPSTCSFRSADFTPAGRRHYIMVTGHRSGDESLSGFVVRFAEAPVPLSAIIGSLLVNNWQSHPLISIRIDKTHRSIIGRECCSCPICGQ
jgi:hypothetical protein